MDHEPGDLKGATWHLVGMIDDSGVFIQVLGNVVITAFFDDQDRVSGSSGCNRYTGPAIHADGSLSFGAVAGTRMMCSDSQVMAQESRYIELLARVGAYRISPDSEGRKCELVDAEGKRIMEFSDKW